ncbi:MAG: DUF393 domain-containing protein [Desulfuromusa sp.]|nr:DUF393 domain-containing protein [Desulfuromusa sp.]
MATSFPLQVFYDGACMVCAAEMDSYRKSNPENRLVFVDIGSDSFAAETYGKTQKDFMARLHVRDAAGNFSTGIEAFMVIWQAYPSGSLYRLLSALVGLPGINLFSRLGYSIFARNRHMLPKRNRDCLSGNCDLNH